jgi:hypothetical protein
LERVIATNPETATARLIKTGLSPTLNQQRLQLREYYNHFSAENNALDPVYG